MKKITQKGFTMIEMVVVLGIFGVLSAIVVFNYDQFRSETILTNMAYEVALTIREAQIYGVSVRKGGPAGFEKPYGVHFMTENPNQYFLFADVDSNNTYNKDTCTPSANDTDDNCVTPYTLQRNIAITDLRLIDSCSPIDSLDIVFKRPNPEPMINSEQSNSAVQITLTTPDEKSRRYIVIYNNGQITVENTDKTSCSIL